MGYTTSFTGKFTIAPPLTPSHLAELHALIEENGNDPKWFKRVHEGAPHGYLQWEPTKDGAGLGWDGNEKFYDYTEWLAWLYSHWLKNRGYRLYGAVDWHGEDVGDIGHLRIVDDGVVAVEGRFAAQSEAKGVRAHIEVLVNEIARRTDAGDDPVPAYVTEALAAALKEP